jgi:hypothetical protein
MDGPFGDRALLNNYLLGYIGPLGFVGSAP